MLCPGILGLGKCDIEMNDAPQESKRINPFFFVEVYVCFSDQPVT